MWLGRTECIGEVVAVSQPVYSEPQASGRRREIIAILLLAVSVLIVLSLHTNAAGAVGLQLSKWLRLLFGMGAVAPALFLFAAGLMILRPRAREGWGRRTSALFVMYAAALTGYHLIVTEIEGPLNEYWVMRLAEEMRGGGYLGAFLGSQLLVAFGPWGSAVVLTAVLLVGVVLYLDTPVSRVVALIVGAVARVLRGGATGVGDFFRGLVGEMRDLIAALSDKRRRARAERAARQAQAAKAVRSSPAPSRKSAAPVRRSARQEAAPVADLGEVGGAEPAGRRAAAASDERDVASAVDEAMPQPESGSADDQQGRGAPGGLESVSRPAAESRSKRAPAAAEASLAVAGAPPTAVQYVLPDPAILDRPKESARSKRAQEGDDQGQLLEETLATFGVQAKVVQVSRGPVVTRYELQPAPGIKVSRIVNLADDVALALAAAGVRIEAPVPGKSVVGIEVPNKETSVVYFREVVESPEFQKATSKLAIGLGKDIAGNPVIADLTKLLHVLIAGATGSGKSVCINTLICSLLYRAKPDEVKLLMIDPKRVELAVYDGIPHLITPVVTDPKLASNALRWAVKEMENRYKKFSEARVRNIDGYNRGIEAGAIDDELLPYLVVIVDELADLMLVAGNEVEDSICRLAQMARAAGIHLVIATQRPSVDVITGLIKANVPSRISFAVSSGVDSRTILDMMGAERLIGKGDMLYFPIGANKPIRAQGAWISDKEVQAVVNFWKKQGEPVYEESVTEVAKGGGPVEEGDDELFEDAVRLVVETGNASISMLQRRFRIGYARAARLIDMMELQGIVGPYQGSKPREVLRTIDDLEAAGE